MADINSFRKISFNPFRKKGIVMGIIAVGAIGVISVTSVLVGQRQDLQQKASENNDITISGNVYYDQNLSGSYDAGDVLLNKNFGVIPNLMPEMTPIDPDQNGFYTTGLPKAFGDYQVSVNGGSNSGGKNMMIVVGDGSGYFVNSQQSGEHKNLDFGVIYQTPHLGPQNTCMIKIIVQRQPLVERRGNVTATVAIFTNKSKPQNVDVSFEGNLLPDQKNPRLDLSFFDSNVVALPNPISSLIQGTSDGMVKCTVTDQISGQTLDTKYVKYRFVFDHGAKDIQILDDQGGNYPIPKFSDIPQMQAIQNGNNLNESSITGVVFYDQNMNGVKDPGEPTVDGKKYGLQIRLTGRKDDVQDVGSEGTYTFTNLKREGGYYELQPLAKFDGQANLALFTTTPYRFDAYYWQNDKNVNFGIIFNNPNSGPLNNCQVKVAPQPLNQFPYAQIVNMQFPVIVTTNKSANTSVEVVSESPKLYPVPGNPWVIPLRDDSYVGGINFAASYIVSSNNDTGSVTISCVVKDKSTHQVLFKNSANVDITRTNMGNAVTVAYPQDSNYTIPPLTTQSQSTPTFTPTATVAITQTPIFTLTPSLVPTKPNTPTPTKRITPTPTRVSFPTRRPLPTKTPTPIINRNNCRVADLNCDGKVDEADFNLFLREYNNSRNQ